MRKKKKFKKQLNPDPKYGNELVAKFINHLTKDGKKMVAQRVMYRAFDLVQEKVKDKEPLEVFDEAIKNASPLVEVRSRRIGGAHYQVPREVRGERKTALAMRWVIKAARSKKGQPMSKKLAQEFIDAFYKEGAAVRKKEETHKIAESNKAFAHFGW